MRLSLTCAMLFGILAAFAPNWQSFLALRCLCGIALSGVPAVAMTYVAEEVAPSAIGPAIGLYIAGSAVGGMIGRLGAGVLVDWFDWRGALGTMGVFSTAAAVTFCVSAPVPRASQLRHQSFVRFVSGYIDALRDPVLVFLYLSGFLLMGVFMVVYNYIPYRFCFLPTTLTTVPSVRLRSSMYSAL